MSRAQTKLYSGKTAVSVTLVLTALSSRPAVAVAQAQLGCAQAFAVLGATTVTNTGATTIKGNLGVYPGSAITGNGSISLVGAVHKGDPVAMNAQGCALSAFNTLFLLPVPPANVLTGQDLGGRTLLPGVYSFSSTAQLTGNLFLDFLGNPNAQFVFQIGSKLTTASNSSVTSIGGGPFGSIYWLIGSSGTLGTATAFQGNIIAKTSIALQTGATVICGRALALTGAVTMDHNVVSNDCLSPGGISPGDQFIDVAIAPEPSTLALLGVPLVVLLVLYVRRSQT